MRTLSGARIFLAGVVGATSFLLTEAKADCNPRDFAEIKDIQQSGETELAFALTATEQEFEKAKKGGATSGSYGGIISGSANVEEAREKAHQIATATKFDYASSYAYSYFSQSISPILYLACLEKEKQAPGITMWLGKRQGDYFTFNVSWIGTDTSFAAASYDAPPVVDGGTVVSKPDTWLKQTTEEVVVKRNGNNDFYLRLKIGGKVKTVVIVKDPPAVAWNMKSVTSDRLIKASSSGPNPGCSSGQAKDCIYPMHPGGHFVAKSAAMTEGYSTDPSTYGEKFEERPDRVCVTMIQSTGACEVAHSAQGRLTAIEKFPVSSE